MTVDTRDSELPVGGPRSRKAFRFMPSAVLSHNLPATAELTNSVGRNLFGRKLRENSDPPPRRDMLRWQTPLAYLIVAQGSGWMLTWHAPWCRRCDCVGAGWRFTFERGYLAGLGFELSFPRRPAP